LIDKKIDHSYDSHVHFFGVGIPAVQWKISSNDITLKLPNHLKNQDFIKGFGWSDKVKIDEFKKLTQVHPDKFFCLSYFDGHKSFVSQNLINKLNFRVCEGQKFNFGSFISEVERDELYKLLPQESLEDLERMALYSQNVFQAAGVKRVRHLTANTNHWTVLKKLEKENRLKLDIEVFFSEFMGQSLDSAALSFEEASKENSNKVKACGVKLFYDGSFGSNTAYTDIENATPPRITKIELEKKMRFILVDLSAPVAIHAIGNKALEDTLDIYSTLSKEHPALPTLHLEHAPIFNKSSLELLKQKKINCVFHFQPSHWIDDYIWYQKNKSNLGPHKIYPFHFLEKNNYPFFFGSDAPVVETSKEKTLLGLSLIKKDQTDS
jgi:predicted amidohydrolase YtcJ